MKISNPSIKKYTERIAAWAEIQVEIRAIIVVGSQARSDHPADEWSDLDLQVFCTDFQAYLGATDWVEEVDRPWMCIPCQVEGQEPERLFIFENGQKVDFHFFYVDELRRMAQSQVLEEVYERGYDALVDKDGLARQLPPRKRRLRAVPPSPENFLQAIDLFWYEALFNAKMIRRRELWFVKAGDRGLKQGLLQMMEWHAQAAHGWEYDTWHDGKHLLEWIDPRAREKLGGLFSRFDATDSWHDLLETISLFSWLAAEMAMNQGYAYPMELERKVRGVIESLYMEGSI